MLERSLDKLRHLVARESVEGRALANNLGDNPVCTVRYHRDVPCISVQWKAYATSSQLRYIHECLIRLLEKHGVSKILGDDAGLVGIAVADQRWILQDWIPRAMAAGLKSAVCIKPRAPFGQTCVNRIVSSLPPDLAVRSFDGLEEGLSWLRDEYQPGTYRILYRRFRGGESIHTFAFWCQDPSVAQFLLLARVALRAFWKVQNGGLEPVMSRQPLPELIVVEDERGGEICRWSFEDEIQELRRPQRR
jgi:hypothetical protein